MGRFCCDEGIEYSKTTTRTGPRGHGIATEMDSSWAKELVLSWWKRLEHARARGAKILLRANRLRTFRDAYHMTAPPPDGEGAASRYADGARSRQDFAPTSRLH
jgi:hypothetical protein